ncbi:MAG: thioredoxin family protein [Candidatus Micrarchaeota archaeon]
MEVSRNILAKAAIITILLFAISIFVGYQIESNSYAATEARLSDMEQDMENTLLFTLFLQTHNDSSVCTVLNEQLNETAQHAYNLYGELEESRSTSVFFGGYNELREKYFLANMRFYLMLREYSQACNDTSVKPILFFYSAYNDCPACVAQGRVLDQVRAECPNARVYAFPADVEEISMIKTFKSYYRITSTPVLVIDDQKYGTLLTKDQIESRIGCAD